MLYKPSLEEFQAVFARIKEKDNTTYVDMAYRIDMSAPLFSMILAGKRKPPKGFVSLVLNAFRVKEQDRMVLLSFCWEGFLSYTKKDCLTLINKIFALLESTYPDDRVDLLHCVDYLVSTLASLDKDYKKLLAYSLKQEQGIPLQTFANKEEL